MLTCYCTSLVPGLLTPAFVASFPGLLTPAFVTCSTQATNAGVRRPGNEAREQGEVRRPGNEAREQGEVRRPGNEVTDTGVRRSGNEATIVLRLKYIANTQ